MKRTALVKPLSVALSICLLGILVVAVLAADEYFFANTNDLALASTSLDHDYRAEADAVQEKYRQWTYKARQRAYDWQTRSTKVLFVVSILVALSGVGFAFWQFVSANEEVRGALEENQLEIRSHLLSLAFRSRSIAALVLFMSIAYLLIYALLIYPIKDSVTAPGANIVAEEPRGTDAAPPVEAASLTVDFDKLTSSGGN